MNKRTFRSLYCIRVGVYRRGALTHTSLFPLVEVFTHKSVYWELRLPYFIDYHIIGVSLSEPHTSVTTLRTRTCVYLSIYLTMDRPLTGNFKSADLQNLYVHVRVHFKFKFDSENDHGVLTIFLNDSGSTECEREIASCSQTVQITPIVEFASGKSMHNRHS